MFFTVIAVTLLILLLSPIGFWIWSWLVVLAEGINARYGIDLAIVIALFGVGEILFCGSIAMILQESGKQVSWQVVRTFKMSKLSLGNRRMLGWLWVNRFSWIVPWVIVIIMSAGQVPWVATVAALGEVGATFALGMIVSLGLKLPWWNDGSNTKQY